MSYSLDVNLLLYASDDSSAFHAEARRFLESCMSRNDVLYLSWPTIMGYLRIATHPSIFDEPLTPDEAMANVETLLNLPQSRCLAEEDGFWATWRATTDEVPARGNLVPDAHLAALLRFHGVRRLCAISPLDDALVPEARDLRFVEAEEAAEDIAHVRPEGRPEVVDPPRRPGEEGEDGRHGHLARPLVLEREEVPPGRVLLVLTLPG